MSQDDQDKASAWRTAYHASVYEFAKVSLQGILAVSSGGFISALAIPQLTGHHPGQAVTTAIALLAFGMSTLLSVSCAYLGYLNQAYIAFWGERVVLAKLAHHTGRLAFLGCLIGGAALLVMKVGAMA